MINIPRVGVYNLMKENDWRVPCYSFGKELRKNLLLNEESFKYTKCKSQLSLDIDNINLTKTPKWTLDKLERFFSKSNSAQLERIKIPGRYIPDKSRTSG